MASTRFESWDKTVEALLDGFADPGQRQKLFAEFAIKERNRAARLNQRQLQRKPNWTTYVDGAKGRSEYEVNPDRGRIIYEFDLLGDIIKWIGDELVRLSPIGQSSDKRPGHPGLYQDSHAFYADGERVPMGAPIPEGAKEYAYVNLTPYARKMEKALSDQAKKGVYMAVAADAKLKFKALVDIRYGFRILNVDQTGFNPYRSKTELAARIVTKRGDRSERGIARAVHLASTIHKSAQASRQPAIIIRPE